jgi:type VI secretion system protein ImpH
VESDDRATAAGLIELLRHDARSYSFFQIVQLAEAASRGVEIGGSGSVADEPLRFRPDISLAHPASDVSSVERIEGPDGKDRLLVETTFLGLYGTMSPLPTSYAEEMLHEDSEESLVRGFLDIFHHRLIALFYRCWKKYRHHVQYRKGAQDEFSRRLLSLAGLNVEQTGGRLSIPNAKMLRYAGLLSQRPCPAASLRCILDDYFGEVAAQVTPCVGRWVTIPQRSRCRLGRANSTLGVDMQLGERVYDVSGKYRVSLGPMEMQTYESFLPGGKNLEELQEILNLATSDLLAYEVELELQQLDLPELRLQKNSSGTRLGQTTWLKGQVDWAGVVLQCHGASDPNVNPPEAAGAAATNTGV